MDQDRSEYWLRSKAVAVVLVLLGVVLVVVMSAVSVVADLTSFTGPASLFDWR